LVDLKLQRRIRSDQQWAAGWAQWNVLQEPFANLTPNWATVSGTSHALPWF